jgi:homoserine dehydrogenase
MRYYSSSHELSIKPIALIEGRYYLRFTVQDKPGVLASIAGLLGEEGISLASVMQKEGFSAKKVPVIILTHVAIEKNLRSALMRIEAMNYIKDHTQVIRIEE